jgi:hypothetical protein
MPLKATPAVAAPTTASIPTWTGIDGTYSYRMIGQNPAGALANATTTITAPIVPLKLIFADGTVFDPSTADNTCSSAGSAVSLLAQSPLFNNSAFAPGGTSVGNTQYLDFFQRANFWKYTGPSAINPNYHTLFTAAPLNPITVNVPLADGRIISGNCGKLGEVNLNWFDNYLQNTVYPQAGILPSQFPVFLLYNVAVYDPLQPGLILGYHSAFSSAATGNANQIYVVGDFDTTGLFGTTRDVSDLTHEFGEALDDPLGDNPTPAWGNVGQVSGCQTDLEVGDPLSGTNITVTMTNGYVYHLQELAFLSWFYRDSPSIAVNGWFSSNNSFTSSAAACGSTGRAATMTLTLSPATAGSQSTFHITVTPAASSATPTGNVSLVTSGGSTLTTVALSGGSASGTVTLPASTTAYTVVATYAGNSTFDSSTSPSVLIAGSGSQLKATATTLSVGTTALPTGGLDAIVIQVSPANASGTPTGNVKLVSSTGGTLATLTLANGAISGNVSLPAGTYTLTAQYAGDSTFAASNSTAITINPAATPLKATVTTLSLSSNVVPSGGSSVTATMHVTAAASAGGTPTGSVKLVSSLGTTLGTFTLTNGAATAAVTLPSGNYTVTAQYSGDTAFAASVSAPVTINPPTTPGQGQLTLSATSLAFGNAAVGTTTAAKTLTITNSGSGTVVLLIALAGTNPSDFTRSSSCGFSLGAGRLCSVTIGFRPSAAGGRAASLLVGGLTSASQQAVALTGTGTGGPQFKLSATSLSFPSSAVGTSTAAQTVTVTNTGTVALKELFLALAGSNARDFVGTTTCGLSLAAGANCSVSLTFQPTVAGARSATLQAGASGTGAAQTVALTGTGTGGPQLSLNTASLSFGTSAVGTSTAAQTVTVSNPGTSILNGLQVLLSGTDSRDFSKTNGCGFSLAAGGTCSIQVVFDPRATGARSASLTVSAGLAGFSSAVALSGTGK